MKKNILYVCGSLNQTTQMHQISQLLPEYDHYFTQFYSDIWLFKWAAANGLMDMSIMGPNSAFWKASSAYLKKHDLKTDFRGEQRNIKYDLVVVCNDMVLPQKALDTKIVWLQEGMIDKMNAWAKFVHTFSFLPKWFTRGTPLNGTSNRFHVSCIASDGYREHFLKMGVPDEKIFVTGIPNFDNLETHLDNDFPLKDYILVATSDIRETLGKEDRPAFLRKCTAIANGRQLVFRLHPNENYERAEREIKENCPPDTLIYQTGNTNDMVANCDELITQWSSVVYVGIALGKPIHSWFNHDDLYSNCPIQNGGTSASQISNLCRKFVEDKGDKHTFSARFKQGLVGTSVEEYIGIQ